MKSYKDFEMFSKDQAYWERNQLVAALSKEYPSWLEFHPESDVSWDPEWRTIVFIDLPTGQTSWHLHDSEVDLFTHLNFKPNGTNSWDGHTTEEKYERLRNL